MQPTNGYYVDSASGVIYVNYSALPENHKEAQLAVVATDHGKLNRSSVALVRITSGVTSEIKPFIGQDAYR